MPLRLPSFPPQVTGPPAPAQRRRAPSTTLLQPDASDARTRVALPGGPAQAGQPTQNGYTQQPAGFRRTLSPAPTQSIARIAAGFPASDLLAGAGGQFDTTSYGGRTAPGSGGIGLSQAQTWENNGTSAGPDRVVRSRELGTFPGRSWSTSLQDPLASLAPSRQAPFSVGTMPQDPTVHELSQQEHRRRLNASQVRQRPEGPPPALRPT